MEKEYRFNCVVEQEGDAFVALCLDLDVASEGDTEEEAMEKLAEAVNLYLITAIEKGMEGEFVPRPVPPHIYRQYCSRIRELTFDPQNLSRLSGFVQA